MNSRLRGRIGSTHEASCQVTGISDYPLKQPLPDQARREATSQRPACLAQDESVGVVEAKRGNPVFSLDGRRQPNWRRPWTLGLWTDGLEYGGQWEIVRRRRG